jgi:hypothetical protein
MYVNAHSLSVSSFEDPGDFCDETQGGVGPEFPTARPRELPCNLADSSRLAMLAASEAECRIWKNSGLI